MSDAQPHATHLLDPPLPFDMRPRIEKALADIPLQQAVASATHIKNRGRTSLLHATFGDRLDAVRSLAAGIKQHTLDHLDVYIERFIDAAGANGTQVHLARDGAHANEIILAIAKSSRPGGAKLCVKSKSMVTEETLLVPQMQAAGIETVETDLGEFIVQLDGDAPSHIVTPMIHKNRQGVGRTFERLLGAGYTDDPNALAMIARAYLRQKYRDADIGLSGANFLVADTGSLVICTNEGNADLSISTPPVHVALVGIEKLIPSLGHLSVFLKLLARSATAQPMTVYSSIITGPRRGAGPAAEPDGPRELHVVLIDNGRSRVLAEETRELLRCIRCGACLNACPVYRTAGGGHAYGAVYSGPIGAVLTPHLKGPASYPDLPRASSLCGACLEACPVKIDIPRQLVALRATLNRTPAKVPGLAMAMRAWTAAFKRPFVYRLMSRVGGALGRAMADDAGWLRAAPPPVRNWTNQRDLPAPAKEPFHLWWARREETKKNPSGNGADRSGGAQP